MSYEEFKELLADIISGIGDELISIKIFEINDDESYYNGMHEKGNMVLYLDIKDDGMAMPVISNQFSITELWQLYQNCGNDRDLFSEKLFNLMADYYVNSIPGLDKVCPGSSSIDIIKKATKIIKESTDDEQCWEDETSLGYTMEDYIGMSKEDISEEFLKHVLIGVTVKRPTDDYVIYEKFHNRYIVFTLLKKGFYGSVYSYITKSLLKMLDIPLTSVMQRASENLYNCRIEISKLDPTTDRMLNIKNKDMLLDENIYFITGEIVATARSLLILKPLLRKIAEIMGVKKYNIIFPKPICMCVYDSNIDIEERFKEAGLDDAIDLSLQEKYEFNFTRNELKLIV